MDELHLREVAYDPLSGIYVNIAQLKIDELKETSANRDVNSGGKTGGVTAASAIAALQEAGNKSSRDIIASSYRTHTEVCKLCVELIRQFYTERRAFRVTGPGGDYSFVDFDNSGMREQQIGTDAGGAPLYRVPVFDLKMRAQKKNPFSRMEQNERAKELYGLGFFNPERAQEALGALEMMDFEGIDKVREQAREGQTLLKMVEQLGAQVQQLSSMVATLTGDGNAAALTDVQPRRGAPGAGAPAPTGMGESESARILQAQTPMTGYGQRLAKRSTPEVE